MVRKIRKSTRVTVFSHANQSLFTSSQPDKRCIIMKISVLAWNIDLRNAYLDFHGHTSIFFNFTLLIKYYIGNNTLMRIYRAFISYLRDLNTDK